MRRLKRIHLELYNPHSDHLNIGFQGVLETAKVLTDEGKIIILDLHHENQTGRKLLDSIKFIRVR